MHRKHKPACVWMPAHSRPACNPAWPGCASHATASRPHHICGPAPFCPCAAITPEPHIKDRKSVWLGHYYSPSLTRALFDAAIGYFPVVLDLKSTSGQNLLYTVNGRRSGLT